MSLPLLKAVAVLAGLGTAGYLAAGQQNSAGGVSVAGPVCVRHTVQPGDTVTATASVVNGSGATAKADLSTDPVIGQPVGPPYPDGGHPVHKTAGHRPGQTWAEVSGPYTIAPGATVQGTVTVHVAPGAPKGQYGTMVYAVNYGHPSPGEPGTVTEGTAGGAGVYFAMSVGARPPPHCGGQQDWPWASDWTPPLPVCKATQAPLRGRQAVCRVLPLPPPAVSARICHWTRAHWAQYMRQLGHGKDQYGRPMRADAHCMVDGRLLNVAAYYARTGMYRYADNGQGGPVGNARPANNPDSWRTSGSS